MACINDSLTLTLDVSSWYPAKSVTSGYYDGSLPSHLSLMAIALSHGTNEMLTTHTGASCPPTDLFASSPQLSSGMVQPSRDQIIPASKDLTDSPCSKYSLTIPGLRAKMFHRSVSIADLQAGKRLQSLEPDRACLRRAPLSTYDLRSYAQTQDQLTRDGETLQARSFQKPYSKHPLPEPEHETRHEEKRLRRKFQYKSYQDLHILSMYQENGSVLSLNSIRQPQSAIIESSSEASNSTESSPLSSPRPRTPTSFHWADQLHWNQKARTDDNKLRRTNARQVHVIEQKDELDESEHEIMQATVLIGPGKPRLIQIHRPLRSDHSSRRQQHNNDYQDTSESTTTTADWHKEQSIRSSYHTLASMETRLSETSIISRPSTPTTISQHHPRLSVNTSLGTDSPRTMSSRVRPSTGSSNTAFSIGDNKISNPSSPSSNYTRRRSSSDSCNTSILDESPPRHTYISSTSTQVNAESETSTLDQFYDQRKHYQLLDCVITSTNSALDALAAHEFDLISPILLSFRSDAITAKCTNTTDNTLIANLNKIFPQISFFALSTLAAWLIVDAYYTHLFATAPTNFTSSNFNQNQYSYASSPSSSPSPKTPQLPRITISAATSPDHSSRPHSRTTISTPIHPSNIPSKAKSILGISNAQSPQTHIDAAGYLPSPSSTPPSAKRPSKSTPLTPARMDEKAKIVHASVQTVGRKLVSDILAAEKRPRIKHRLRSGSKSGIGIGMVSGGMCSSVHEKAVNALWEACRCVASTGSRS